MKALLICALVPTLAVPLSHAAGKKPAGPGPTPGFETANPFRLAAVKPVGTRPFTLPNGSRVDLQADLEVMLTTAVTTKSRFLPSDGAPEGPACEPRLEIRAAVSTLEMNIASLGLTFGYKPSGETSVPITNLTGKLNVTLGTVAMDFGVWQCVGTQCAEVAASTATHVTAGVGLSLEIDFGVVQTGPALLFNTPLGPVLRKIMEKGMQELALHPRVSKLAWKAHVREVAPEGGTLIFDAGTSSGLAANQAYEVYAKADAQGSCDVFRTVALVHSTRTDNRASTAAVDQVFDARGIQAGDVVMIHETR